MTAIITVGMALAFITGSTMMIIQLITLGKTNIIMAHLLIGDTTTIIDGATTIIATGAVMVVIVVVAAAAVTAAAGVEAADIAADIINK